MSLSLEQLAARIDDPETPILWLDPSLPEEIWRQLPAAAAALGFRVLSLDGEEPIASRASLLDSLARAAGLPAAQRHDQQALRECLQKLPAEGKGCVIFFHYPEALRQNDEVAFEDFLDITDQIHESWMEARGVSLKLVVRD